MSEENGGAPPVVGIRLADGDGDVIVIHRFLCVVAQSVLLSPIGAEKSMAEIDRICSEPDYGFALMAMRDDVMVGTIGCINPAWWYGDDRFVTDRWFFAVPGARGRGIGGLLLGEAVAMAHASDAKFVLQGKIRKRKKFFITDPVLIEPGSNMDLEKVAEHVLRQRGDGPDRVDADA